MMAAVTYTYCARPNPARRAHQRAECEALAHELGLTVTRIYEDENGDRSALDKLRTDAGAGAITELFISGVDRLGRTVGTAPRHMEALLEAGVIVYATASGSRPFADSGMLSMLRTLADFEDEHTESRPGNLNAWAKLLELATARFRTRWPSRSETP